MKKNLFLLYGANGYTGQLIARLAVAHGLNLILAGRREETIKPLANELKLDYRIVDLLETKKLEYAVSDIKVVLNAAGPFQYTASYMIEACLATKTHYLDITGEIAVFEMAKKYNNKAVAVGVMLLPGVGFDVVPTDCLALFLKSKLPDANQLKLAFTTLKGSISHGTAMTMTENLGGNGAVRINGKIISVPIGHKSMKIDFGYTEQFVMSIPWGDIATAYHTTGIPDIETYTGVSRRIYRMLRFQKLFNWLLRIKFVRNLIKKRINAREAGPSAEARQKAKSLVWGEVMNSEGKVVQARLSCPESYTLTAHSCVILIKKFWPVNTNQVSYTCRNFWSGSCVRSARC